MRELPSLHMQRTRDHTAGRALQSTSEPSAYSMPNPLCTNASNRVFSQAAKFKTLGFWACRVERETVSALNDPRVGPGSDPTQPRQQRSEFKTRDGWRMICAKGKSEWEFPLGNRTAGGMFNYFNASRKVLSSSSVGSLSVD